MSKGKSTSREVALAERDYLQEADVKLYNSTHHIRDFLNAVANRTKPITSEIVGGGTAICCHLMNIGYYHNKLVKWDPSTNTFAGGTGDAKWLTRDYRAPYSDPA